MSTFLRYSPVEKFSNMPGGDNGDDDPIKKKPNKK